MTIKYKKKQQQNISYVPERLNDLYSVVDTGFVTTGIIHELVKYEKLIQRYIMLLKQMGYILYIFQSFSRSFALRTNGIYSNVLHMCITYR